MMLLCVGSRWRRMNAIPLSEGRGGKKLLESLQPSRGSADGDDEKVAVRGWPPPFRGGGVSAEEAGFDR
ncbi:MAG: hypothetical protein U0411_14570 [Thermodesulfovibrionales bacterium]